MSVWNTLGSGNWGTASNWSGGIPDAIGATADLTPLASASITHHVDLALGDFTVGVLKLASSSIEKYSVENGNLTLDVASGKAQISVASSGAGSPLASILGPTLNLVLASATQITTTGLATTLDIQGQLYGTASLFKEGTGTLILSQANHSWGGNTYIHAGTIEIADAQSLSSGQVLFTGNSALRGSADLTITNQLFADSGVSATFEAATGTTLTLGGSLFSAAGGAGTVLHFGSASDAGTVYFAPTSVSTLVNNPGPVSIDGGTLKAGASLSALLSNSSGTYLAAGATLDQNGFYLGINHLFGSGTLTNNGPGNGYVQLNESGTSTFSGVIEDGLYTTNVAKHGDGTTILSGANTYSGYTIIYYGTLQAGAEYALSAGSAVSIDSGAILDLGGYNQVVAGLEGSGLVRGNSASTVYLSTDVGSGLTETFAGNISDGSFGGDLALSKTGGGTQELSGVNTYTGDTVIVEGTLALTGSGSIAASSSLSMYPGGVFDISGIAGDVAQVQQSTGGIFELGGKTLFLTHQATSLVGNFIGSAQEDGLLIYLAATVVDFELSFSTFINWTDAVDQISIVGNSLDNILTGTSHADAIYGGGGADIMRGLGGDDTYYIDSADDIVDESLAGSSGIDTVHSYMTVKSL